MIRYVNQDHWLMFGKTRGDELVSQKKDPIKEDVKKESKKLDFYDEEFIKIKFPAVAGFCTD